MVLKFEQNHLSYQKKTIVSIAHLCNDNSETLYFQFLPASYIESILKTSTDSPIIIKELN
jgi:hypothetical protein